MNIVILGAGSVGSYLASLLSIDEHNVIVIDRDPKALDKLTQTADVATRLGSGTNWELLQDLLDQKPDLFIALSSDDETNLTACTLAKHLGYPKTVARIRDSSYLDRSQFDLAKLFSVDHFVGTERIVAHEVLKSILHPGSVGIETFAHGAIQMRTLILPETCPYIGKKLSELRLPENLLVGLIHRKPPQSYDEELIFPKGHHTLLAGDEVSFIGETPVMEELPQMLGIVEQKVHSVVIVGGSAITLQLAHLLQKQSIRVKIIEKEESTCLSLAAKLPKATILNQDGTDLDFLIQQRVGQADVFVACTCSHETNILSAALARQAGCKQVISLVSDASYAPLLERLGVTSTLSERSTMARRILSLIQAKAVTSVASLYDNRAKILEVKVSDYSEIAGIPLAELSAVLPQNFLIALIENKGEISVAKGNNRIASGDTVIVICSPEYITELQTIF